MAFRRRSQTLLLNLEVTEFTFSCFLIPHQRMAPTPSRCCRKPLICSTPNLGSTASLSKWSSTARTWGTARSAKTPVSDDRTHSWVFLHSRGWTGPGRGALRRFSAAFYLRHPIMYVLVLNPSKWRNRFQHQSLGKKNPSNPVNTTQCCSRKFISFINSTIFCSRQKKWTWKTWWLDQSMIGWIHEWTEWMNIPPTEPSQ